MVEPAAMTEPKLVKAADLRLDDIGTFAWDPSHNDKLLSVSDDGLTVTWGPRKPTYEGKHYPPVWAPIRTRARFHSGKFRWDFVIDEMAERQIGIAERMISISACQVRNWHEAGPHLARPPRFAESAAILDGTLVAW
jgi:hypothetical protein